MEIQRNTRSTSTSVWMTLNEAATYLRKPPSWIYDNVHKQEIPHVRLERQYRFRAIDLENWLERRTYYRTAPLRGDAA